MAQKEKEYDVSFIEEVRRDSEGKYSRTGEKCGGDEHFLKSFKTSKEAIKFGKEKSFQKTFYKSKVHEVYIRCHDEEEDSVENWYIKNGKVTHHDKG